MRDKTRPKPNRSKRQYKRTRNYALIFSYRSLVAIVPIGISGVRPRSKFGGAMHEAGARKTTRNRTAGRGPGSRLYLAF